MRLLDDGLKVCKGGGPHVIEVGSEARHALGIQPIEAARPDFAIRDEPGVPQDLEVLRDGGACDRQPPSELVDGQRAARKALEDRHTSGVCEGIQPGLEVSVH